MMNISNDISSDISNNRAAMIEEQAGNMYYAINVLARRSNQISLVMKEELTSKLAEFASTTDNLEEVFENREQIEISRFYEKLPKPPAIAMDEYMAENTYFRLNEES